MSNQRRFWWSKGNWNYCKILIFRIGTLLSNIIFTHKKIIFQNYIIIIIIFHYIFTCTKIMLIVIIVISYMHSISVFKFCSVYFAEDSPPMITCLSCYKSLSSKNCVEQNLPGDLWDQATGSDSSMSVQSLLGPWGNPGMWFHDSICKHMWSAFCLKIMMGDPWIVWIRYIWSLRT